MPEPYAALRGQTALITGALGTLGRAQAAAFADVGVRVILLDRPEAGEAGDHLAADLGDAIYVGCDLGDLDRTDAMARRLATTQDIHILINNAAMIVNRPFAEFSIPEYEEQVRVNSTAPFVLAAALAPPMKARGYGKIINFCSVTLNGHWDGYVPYVASKGAMLGLTKSLARELGPFGVRVNAISPGAVVSEAEARVFPDAAAYSRWVLENQCLKVRIQPQAIADLVLFLSSARSDMITGQNIAVDGGW